MSSSRSPTSPGSVVLGDQDLPDEGYLTVSEDADSGGEEYDVRVAASLEDVEESTAALVPLLLVGVPLLLLVVGGTTWWVVDPGPGAGGADPAGGRRRSATSGWTVGCRCPGHATRSTDWRRP